MSDGSSLPKWANLKNIDDSESISTWRGLLNELEDVDQESTFQSISGNNYTPDQLRSRVKKEVEIMKEGTHLKESDRGGRPVPRITDDDGNKWMRDLLDQEWYDLLAEDYRENSSDYVPWQGTYRSFEGGRGRFPHQGWKLRVTAYPDEARDVLKTVQPYLKDNNISHKVVSDFGTLDSLEFTSLRGRQEGKFVTIYPSIDEDKQEEIMTEDYQVFKSDDIEWNKKSINSNYNTAEQIVDDLVEIYEESEVDLYGGPAIDGDHGEELQLGDTRIHFRYAHHFNVPAVITEDDGDYEEVGRHQGLVNKEGELIPGKYIGDQIDAAEEPVSYESLVTSMNS